MCIATYFQESNPIWNWWCVICNCHDEEKCGEGCWWRKKSDTQMMIIKNLKQLLSIDVILDLGVMLVSIKVNTDIWCWKFRWDIHIIFKLCHNTGYGHCGMFGKCSNPLLDVCTRHETISNYIANFKLLTSQIIPSNLVLKINIGKSKYKLEHVNTNVKQWMATNDDVGSFLSSWQIET